MRFAPAPLPAELTGHYRSAGLRTGTTLPALMQRNAYEFGGLECVREGDRAFTWGQLLDMAFRFAGFLQAQGIGPGDVVVWQLPNWWEAIAVAYGVWAAGAVSAPVVPSYRQHELGGVLDSVRPKAVVVARQFRSTDHADLMEAALASGGSLSPVRILVRGAQAGWIPWAETIKAARGSPPAVDPADPALVGFTSGTTSGSKAVVMSTQSLLAVPFRHTRAVPYTWRDRGYMPAPISHATGLLMAVTLPLVSGCSAVLADRWDAARAVQDISRQGVTYSGGAEVFIRELVDAVEAAGLDSLPLSSGYNCGGSAIPSDLVRRGEELHMNPRRAYGMTECPTVSASTTFDSAETRLLTDGRVLAGCEVRVVSPEGQDLAADEIGEFVVRGPQRALGYVDPAHTAEAFDADGWFRTGDLGLVRGDGHLIVTGRTKDIINRGGEKLSAREIEEAIARYPRIREVAVVAAPHPRLGEEPAAFIAIAATDSGPTDGELMDFVHAQGLAPHKVPRTWVRVDDFPRTSSGKVKKHELLERLPAT